MNVITDLQGDIEYVNPMFTEVTGYTLAEARGRNPRVLKSGAQPVAFYEEMWRTILAGRTWRGEVLRLAMLRTHYRQPIDFTVKALEEAELSLRKWGAEIGAVDLHGDGFGGGFGALPLAGCGPLFRFGG